MKYFLLLLNLMTFFKCFQSDCARRPILIVVLFDGFKNEYLTRNVTPNLLKFREKGVYTKSLKTLNFSNTFQAQQTIITGVHSWKHGVVGHITQSRFPSDYNTIYNYSERLYNYGYKSGIEPIWATNQFNGGRSACMMWAGCEFAYKNESPAFLVKYNASVSIKKRLETVAEWLNSSGVPPNLILVYIDEPDKMGHTYGPDSAEVTNVLQEIDTAQAVLFEQIRALNLESLTNIIYMSDHGMDPIKYGDLISLYDDWIVKCRGRSPYLPLFVNAVAHQLENNCFLPFRQRFLRIHNPWSYPGDYTDFNPWPLHKEYSKKTATGYIFALPVGHAWREYMEKYEKTLILLNKSIDNNTNLGAHGFFAKYPWLQPWVIEYFPLTNDTIFMAKGPAFNNGFVDSQIELVDFRNLFTYILEIDDDFIGDGNISRIMPLLAIRVGRELVNWQERIVLIVSCAVVHCTTFYVAVNIYIYTRRRRNRNARNAI